MAKMWKKRLDYGVALAFMVLALVGGYAISRAAHHTSFNLCRAANQLRKESNARIPSHEADTWVLRAFLRDAQAARYASYRAMHQPSDLTAARSYGKLIAVLGQKVKFHRVPLIDCGSV